MTGHTARAWRALSFSVATLHAPVCTKSATAAALGTTGCASEGCSRGHSCCPWRACRRATTSATSWHSGEGVAPLCSIPGRDRGKHHDCRTWRLPGWLQAFPWCCIASSSLAAISSAACKASAGSKKQHGASPHLRRLEVFDGQAVQEVHQQLLAGPPHSGVGAVGRQHAHVQQLQDRQRERQQGQLRQGPSQAQGVAARRAHVC